MAKRMLVEATHPEETRVAVVSGNRLEELDFEIASRKQLKGNVYLAKVTRVEPSLQAAFVEYGGNRHGFLAFTEIHPDYYRIPVADREALMAQERAEAERHRAEDADLDEDAEHAEAEAEAAPGSGASAQPAAMAAEYRTEELSEAPRPDDSAENAEAAGHVPARMDGDGDSDEPPAFAEAPSAEAAELIATVGGPADGATVESVPAPDGAVDELGGDEAEEAVDERRRPRPLRSYKIQEVIKRRQILLVQVVKEERGNKGAALTTYLSLPGRYCVLMPNTGRGGGISRKITNPQDRKRLKEILGDLDIPEGMAVILRTAGLERSKPEIKRDLEYLLRLWDSIRELTLQSTAPALIYEEANLIKRAIRDLYANELDEVLVEGEAGYRTAKDFMRMLMPSHAKKVQPYKDETIPLFFRYQVESQIDAIHSPVVQLRSGGYIVINQTEALVAIDVNSGRATKERNIEETALRTNMEAAEEVARQLRLRDLAGLIVIDFIDMEDPKNNAAVERRLKESMKNDRARIQLGRISPFGLLELSRQRLRPSLIETNFEKCPTCHGTGMIRSIESAALYVLRAIEEEGIRKRSSEITVHTATRIALYILNQKRDALADIERRYGFRVFLFGDDSLTPPEYRLERIKARSAQEDIQPSINTDRILAETDRLLEREAEQEEEAEEKEPEAEAEAEAEAAAETENGEERGDRRRRRRRRRGRREEGRAEIQPEALAEAEEAATAAEPAEAEELDEGEEEEEATAAEFADTDDQQRKRRRRGKRGGRRRSRGRGEFEHYAAEEAAAGTPGDVVTAEPPQPAAMPEAVPVAELVDDLGDVFGDLDAAPSDLLGPVPATGPMPPPGEGAQAEAAEPAAPQPRPEGGEPPAIEAAPTAEEAPAKPKKRAATTRRRKKAEPEAAPAEAGEAPAEAATEQGEPAPAKPKKRAAAPRKRKKAEPVAETEPAEAPAGEAAAAEPVPVAPPAAEPRESEPTPVGGEPTRTATDLTEPAAPQPEEAETVGEGQPRAPQSSAAYEVIQDAPESGRTKRGWWSRP